MSHPAVVGIDESHLYAGDATLDHVVALSKACGVAESPSVVATDRCKVSSLAVDAENVYWSHGNGGQTCPAGVFSVAKTGGEPRTLASGITSGQAVAIDDSSLYFIIDPGLWKVPKIGGSPVQLDPDPTARGGPVVGGDFVYWVSVDDVDAKTRVMQTPKKGGPSTIITTVERHLQAIAFEGGRLYWAISGTRGAEYFCTPDCDQPSRIDSFAFGDSAPRTELTLPAGQLIFDLVVDDANIYVSLLGTRSGEGADYPPNDDQTGVLLRAQKGGGMAQAIRTGLPFTNWLNLDEHQIYISNVAGRPVIVAK